jgi:hypothetical protein
MVRDWMSELAGAARELRDVLRRAGRDELRVRAHPRDVLEVQQFMARQTRRVLLAVFSAAVAIVGTMLFVAGRGLLVLVASLAVAGFSFLVALLLPAHLLSFPRRGIGGRR